MRTAAGKHRISTRTSGRAADGIVLVSVLIVLAAILLLGVGSLMLSQSGLMVSENLVTNSVARANAEAGIDAAVLVLFDRFQAGETLPGDPPYTTVKGSQLDYYAPVDWYEMDTSITDPGITDVTLRMVGTGGRNAEFLAEAHIRLSQDGISSGTSPFKGAIVGCEGVDVIGGGRIDSFDSRTGAYSEATSGSSASVGTLAPDAEVKLSGHAPIYGPVSSTGSVSLSGSSPVFGDVHADGNVSLTGNAPIHGSVQLSGDFLATGSSPVHGDITADGNVTIRASTTYDGSIRSGASISLENTATISGNARADGNITFTNGAKVLGNASAGHTIDLNHSGARIGGAARAGQQILNAGTSKIGGGQTIAASPPNPRFLPKEVEACDPLDIGRVPDRFASLTTHDGFKTGYPLNRWGMNPAGVTHFDETWNVQSWTDGQRPAQAVTDVLGQDMNVIKTRSVEMNNGELRISGGDVVWFVDGDLTLGTGGARMVIEQGSTLTVFVTGRTHIGSSFRMVDERDSPVSPVTFSGPHDETGTPTFSLFSSFDQKASGGQDGVRVGGAGQVAAVVYAPLSDVTVGAGGGFFGSARGKTVTVSGGGGLHYDVALGDTDVGAPTTETGGTPTVTILSRR